MVEATSPPDGAAIALTGFALGDPPSRMESQVGMGDYVRVDPGEPAADGRMVAVQAPISVMDRPMWVHL